MLRSAIKTLALATLTGALFLAAFLYVFVHASCTVFDCSKECKPGTVIDNIISPDERYLARIYNSFCGPPGGASNSYSLVLLQAEQKDDAGSLVFGQEDSAPLAHWIANDRLVISPGGWDGFIWQSEHKVGAVMIDYTTDLAAMSAAFVSEQKRISDHFEPDVAQRVNAYSSTSFARFRAWAEGNASASVDR